MQFRLTPKVDFIITPTYDEKGHLLPKFYTDINKIYTAYRQCYSKTPDKEPTISEKRKQELDALLLKYTEELHFPTNILTYSGCMNWVDFYKETWGDKFYPYLHKCDFIAKHMNHESPLEHGNLTVRLTNVSRALTHQWVRSRVASHSQRSQRYVTEDSMDFILPESILKNEQAYTLATTYLAQLPQVAERLRKLGIPNEDVRALFPNCLPTAIVTTCNLREWMHILNERCCTRAQAEIRTVAEAIRSFLYQEIPFVFRYAGSKCLTLGYCPEMNGCGKMPSKDSVIKK